MMVLQNICEKLLFIHVPGCVHLKWSVHAGLSFLCLVRDRGTPGILLIQAKLVVQWRKHCYGKGT